MISLSMSRCKNEPAITYPVTQKVDTVDVYFGTEVPDPYRWLEDDNAPATLEWVKVQNDLTNRYMERIPFRAKIKDRLTQLWDYPRESAPWKRGNRYFFFKNNGIQNQDVLFMQEGLEGEAKILLDPNTLSEDGTVALSSVEVSKDGKYMAYMTATAGSDWNQIQIMNIETGENFSEVLQWIKFTGISWEKDGFYYSRYPEPVEGSALSGKNEYHKVYYHKLGDTQDKDILVYENSTNPQRMHNVQITQDQQHMILYIQESTSGNMVYHKRLDGKVTDFTPIITDLENINGIVENVGDKLLMMTNIAAPKNRLVLVDPNQPAREAWVDIIPEAEEVLESAQVIGNHIVAQYMKDATSRLMLYDLNGTFLHEVELPGLGSIGMLTGQKEDPEMFYTFTSFTFPSSIYRYDIATSTLSLHKESQIDFDGTAYETKQVFYTSKDGTQIPMFIVHKKGLKLNGKNPTLLYGYGGFNVSLTPGFSVSRLVLLENGGVFAMPNLRGGGEYGEAWHKAGTKLQKQNVFDDFIAAAEYLIAEKYTSPEKLAIHGGSNGGLLVGAAMTQRPELFKVALPAVGVLDMLRFHKFTIGWAWTGDYGSSDNEEEFRYLLGYSPLHNIKEGVHYPATLVMTADHDDRVVPAHSFKFIATLQEKHEGSNPVLIRIETKAGHGAGKPTAKRIEEAADLYSFMMYNLGVKL